MSLITALAYTVPFAVAAGLNVYATIAVVGLCSRYEIVALPEQFQAFEHPWIIAAALTMFVIEFVADKIPWVDTIWDAAHTVIRPLGGAVIAATTLGDASPAAETLAALLGGSVALTTHLSKAGTRVAANTSPEPLSNWGLSLFEDGLAIGLTYVALEHPYIALAIAVGLLVLIAVFASVLIGFVRRRFRTWRTAPAR